MQLLNSSRLRERQEGLDSFNDLLKDKSKCFVIHYSCESFVTSHGKTPRVTSICIRNIKAAQTKSFSIHLQAQLKSIDFNNLDEVQYDILEKEMLNDFSKYVKRYSNYKWIHWNMRDSNYGFEAINNRIKILKGSIFEIENDLKYDLPRILGQIYTYEYELHKPNGKLLNLAYRNGISTIQALTGKEEAESFSNKEYLKLHLSTLKKVDIIDSIVYKLETGEIKVASSKKQIYGLSIRGILTIIRETPWLLLIVSILGYIIGAALEPLVQHYFKTGQ